MTSPQRWVLAFCSATCLMAGLIHMVDAAQQDHGLPRFTLVFLVYAALCAWGAVSFERWQTEHPWRAGSMLVLLFAFAGELMYWVAWYALITDLVVAMTFFICGALWIVTPEVKVEQTEAEGSAIKGALYMLELMLELLFIIAASGLGVVASTLAPLAPKRWRRAQHD